MKLLERFKNAQTKTKIAILTLVVIALGVAANWAGFFRGVPSTSTQTFAASGQGIAGANASTGGIINSGTISKGSSNSPINNGTDESIHTGPIINTGESPQTVGKGNQVIINKGQ